MPPQNVVLDVGLMEYGPAVQLSVGSVRLSDKQSKTSQGHNVELLTVRSGDEAINMIYRYVSPDCPDFKTEFKSVQHSFVVDISQVTARVVTKLTLSDVSSLFVRFR